MTRSFAGFKKVSLTLLFAALAASGCKRASSPPSAAAKQPPTTKPSDEGAEIERILSREPRVITASHLAIVGNDGSRRRHSSTGTFFVIRRPSPFHGKPSRMPSWMPRHRNLP